MGRLKAVFLWFSELGIDDTVQSDQVVKIRILNIVCFAGIWIISFLYSLRDILFSRYDLAFYHFLLVLAVIPPLYLNSKKYHNAARLFLFITFPISLIPYNYYLSDIGAENFLFSVVLLSFLLLEKTKTQFLISFYCAAVFIFIKFLLHSEMSLSYYAESAEELFYFNTSQSFVLVTIFAFIYSNQNRQYTKKLEIANEELIENNRLINSLLKELNHRVKNNLQMVSSLFNIQSMSTENPVLREKLGEAVLRMQTLALVYEKLYDQNTDLKIRLDSYLHEHLANLIDNFFIEKPIQKEIQIPEIQLNIEEAIYIGLIINELVTNIHKYGMNKVETSIKILIRSHTDTLEILVSDNGEGFPPDFDPNTAGSFGYELIRILVERYNGTIEVFSNRGTTVKICLKMKSTNVPTLGPIFDPLSYSLN